MSKASTEYAGIPSEKARDKTYVSPFNDEQKEQLRQLYRRSENDGDKLRELVKEWVMQDKTRIDAFMIMIKSEK